MPPTDQKKEIAPYVRAVYWLVTILKSTNALNITDNQRWRSIKMIIC